MTYKDGLNSDQARQMEQDARRRVDAKRERDEWLQLYRVAERCVVLAHKLWDADLEKAAAQQQTLVEQMRDRRVPAAWSVGGMLPEEKDAAIPAPLFTPRDRLEFLKGFAVTLFIDARKSNLTVLYKEPSGEADAPETSDRTEAGQAAAEAASLVALVPLDPNADYGHPPLALVPDPSDEGTAYPGGISISETPAPGV